MIVSSGDARMDLLDEVKRTLHIEKQALEFITHKVDEQVVTAIELLYACEGRVIVIGMGKTGLIARKIAATLASAGTPAFFLHPAEALHGDLGIITNQDVVLIVSNSGETEEVVNLLPSLKRFGVKIISLTGNPKSTLAQHSDVVIDIAVEKEADPLELIPTSSTTAALAMGDALASALVLKRGFSKEQFAIFHPGGSLGRKLLWRVRDLMHTGDSVPIVNGRVTVREAIYEMSRKKLGATCVVNTDNQLIGIFTDGDLRRLLQRHSNPLELLISDVMTRTPKTIGEDALAAESLRIMEDNAITLLPVIDDQLKLFGAIQMHDLVRAGLV